MKKNITIDLLTPFGNTVGVHQLRRPAQGVTIRHADRSYYQSTQQEAILQEFDGRSGYLYSIELHLGGTMCIPIHSAHPDLHILYLMTGTAPIQLIDKNSLIVYNLAPERSCYLYLPAGSYTLCVSGGWSNIFGFYFDGGIFRDGNDKEFSFLAQVLAHYRSRSPRAIASVDFGVGPRTRSAILHLCRNLKRGVLSNEDFISQSLFKLIQLSKKKVDMLPFDDIQTSYIHAVRERIVHELEIGNGIPSLDMVAVDVRLSLRHINRLHQELFLIPLREYAKTMMAALAVPMLQSGMSVTEVSNHFNYSNSSAFARIIKKKTGQPPTYWIKQKNELPSPMSETV